MKERERERETEIETETESGWRDQKGPRKQEGKGPRGRLRRGAGERRKANSMGRVHNRNGFVRVCIDITLRAAWRAGGANSVQVRVELAAMPMAVS